MTASGGGQARSRAAMDAGRRRRLSLQEVEERVMAKARELLIGETGGLTVSLEHINLEVIVAAAGVPRSSAYRRWQTKDEFVVDFLCVIAGSNSFGTAMDPGTIRLGVRLMQERAELLANEDGRRALLRESLRTGVRRDFEAIGVSSEWRTYVALTATVMSITDEDARNKIQMKLRDTETALIDGMTNFYDGLSAFLGFRPRAPYTFRHLAAAGAAVMEGLSLRRIVNPELVTEPLQVPDQEGGTTEWTLAAAGFLAILESMIETNPDHQSMDEQQRADFSAADTDQIVSMIAGEMPR